jgi:ArsR family transcriptional regulator, arsenate/arsenite/antimonite-responsive transcriptional repressor
MKIDSMVVEAEVDAGSLLKLVGEPLRWEIVRRLAVEELCTCHLTSDLGVGQPLVSHHLGVLRQAGVVRTEKVGAFTYYSLDREVFARLAHVLGDLAEAPRDGRRRPCS